MTLAPYGDPERLADRIDRLGAAPGLSVRAFGRSVRGRSLLALELARTSGPEPGGPALCVCANIHGLELVATELALGLVQTLVHPPEHLADRVATLRAAARIVVLPSLNPDAAAQTWRTGGRAPLVELRCNARGVDLNRNFPRPAAAPPSRLPFAGSAHAGRPTYRGPAPLSEPETAAVAALLAELRPHAGANLHAFMGRVITPKVASWADFRRYGALARAFARGQAFRRYRRLATPIGDVFTGEQEDWMHHALGAWAICVETFPIAASLRQHLRAPCTFWRFNPRDLDRWVANDVGGLLGYFAAALKLAGPERPLGAPARPG